MDCVCLYAARSFCIRLFVLPLSCMHCAAHRRQNGAPIFLLWRRAIATPKRAPLFDAAADVCNDFAAVLQQLLRLSVYARMEIYGIFGRRQCVVYAVSALLSLVAWEQHQADDIRTVRRLRRPFVCAALLPLDWGWYALAIVWGCFLHARRSGRPALLLCGIFTVIVVAVWLGALPNLGSQYLQFFSVCFFSLLPMRLYDGTPGAGARVKWRFYLIYPAQFILIPLLGRRLAPLNSAPQCRALAP